MKQKQLIDLNDETKDGSNKNTSIIKEPSSLEKYLSNYKTDLIKSVDYIKDKHSDQKEIDLRLSFAALMIGVYPLLYFIATNDNIAQIVGYLYVWLFSGPAIMLIKYGSYFIYSQIKNRLERLINNFKRNKNKKLDKSFVDVNLLNEKMKNLTNESTSKQEIKNIIPVMINKLIELLREVDLENRGTLINEVKELIVDYKRMINDSSKTDMELFLENKSIRNRIVDLELRIIEARKLNNGRNNEADYLLEKLDNIDNNSEDISIPSITLTMTR